MTRLLLSSLIVAAACESGTIWSGDPAVDARPGGDDDGGGGPGSADGAPGGADGAIDPEATIMVYASGTDDKIHVFELDPASLALTPAGAVDTGARPGFLAFDPDRRWLVAVNDDAGAVQSFSIDSATGALALIDTASSGGGGPTALEVSPDGGWVLIAHFGDGAVTALPIADDGALGEVADSETPGSQAHHVAFAPGGDVAWVPCAGSDLVAVIDLDLGSGQLTIDDTVGAPGGTRPRHLALAPDGQHAWVINESSSVTAYAVGAGGALTAGATVTSLPDGFVGDNSGAEIAVHPSGDWLYVSNRGDDSIARYSIAGDGALTLLGHTPTGGERPRHFSLTPGGRGLLVGNELSNTIHGFHIDPATGALDAVGELTDTVPEPQFVQAIALP